MSKFHSTVTRRDFMKGLGLAGAGLGAAAATAPVFHDLDEVMSSPYSNQSRPWWVKERELMDPTVEIDWSIMQRYDRRNNAQNSNIEDYFYGDQMKAARDKQSAVKAEYIARGDPGYTRKTVAFADAYGVVRNGQRDGWHHNFTGPSDIKLTKTPEELGVPKWQGTPEENAKLLRSASRIYGAAYMGFAELDSTWRNKLAISHTTKNTARIVFENVDQGYVEKDSTGEMEENWVIPTKPMYVVSFGAAEALFNIKTAPSLISAANRFGSRPVYGAHLGMFNLLRTLGYQLLGGCHGHQAMIFNAGAATVLTGMAESSRQNQYVLTPEAGTRINPENSVTDLPLAPTHPIDAGMFKFCHTCAICADTCPNGSISKEKEPSYDVGTYNGKPGIFHNPGPKHFWCDAAGCRLQRKLWGGSCHICYAVCPFNEGREAMVHNLVKGTIATLSLFNGFLANMSTFMGYGARDKEAWWDESLPVYGLESEIYARYK